MSEYHNPVLLEESLEGLQIDPEGTYVDVTFGGGGHSRALLERLGPGGKLYAFDQDTDAVSNNLDDERFQLVQANFKHITRFLKFYGVQQVDGVLGDFGVSSHQFDTPERGFSTRFEGELDMRMDTSQSLSAAHIVNEYSEEQLVRILREYGELRLAPKLARLLVQARKQKEITTTMELREALESSIPRHKLNKELAQLFQALRIEVNDEVGVLKDFLQQLPQVLKTGGRISLISYHSLEDRLVKRFIRDGKFEGQAEKDFYGNILVPFKKVGGLIVPNPDEINQNNRARSAKLRIAERTTW
jgi:16S rRNA (cytosine1402-N4)-methyltransferase